FKNYYQLIFHGVNFISIYSLYEELFGRIPVSLLKERWFVENISNRPKPFYDFFKRIMDFVVALVLGVISLVVYPFVWLAIKADDGGTVFIMQERVGQNGFLIKTYKFRSMSRNETDLRQTGSNQITRVGKVIRKTRIDELPQLWSVVRGDLSLIGPRPELPSGVEIYKEKVPYFDARHLIKPGLSGWAQIYGEHAHHATDTEATVNKLSYDLYYVKNRSLWIDVAVALRTIKIMLSMAGK
ncbi:MAG: sugar transferase, partial [bacterium]